METDKIEIINQINNQIILHEYNKESLKKIIPEIKNILCFELLYYIEDKDNKGVKHFSFISHDEKFNEDIANYLLQKLDDRINQLKASKENIDNYIIYEKIKYLRELINSKQYEIGIINDFILKAKEVNIELYDDKYNNETLSDDKSLLMYLLEKRKTEIEKASAELLELQKAVRMDKQS